MPSRIATGSPESIRALIRSDPSVLQQGLRLLDFDIRTGPATSLDAVGVDVSGSLAIVVVSTEDQETALARLLDGHLWAADQRDLLGRLYAGRGVDGDRPAHGFLLAPSFTHAFLRRLPMLSVQVTPCLAREIEGGEGPRRVIVEPAAALFGLETFETTAPADPEPGREDRRPFWPDGVLPPDDTGSRGARPLTTAATAPVETPAQPEPIEPLDEMPWPDSPEERFPWEMADDAAPAGPVPPDLEPAPAAAFETLTIEELEEFERFERQRTERGRSSS